MRLVGGMTVCLYVFPALLAELRRIHPHLDLKVTVGSAERSIAMLRSGAGDLGLLTLPVEAADLVSVPVLEEELLLVTYPTHPLAKKKTITPPIWTRQPFVAVRDRVDHAQLVDEFFTRERIEPEIVMETENVEIIKAMVRTASASASSPGRRRPPTSARSSCSAVVSPATRSCARPAGSTRR